MTIHGDDPLCAGAIMPHRSGMAHRQGLLIQRVINCVSERKTLHSSLTLLDW